MKWSIIIPMRDEAEAFPALAAVLDDLLRQINAVTPPTTLSVILVNDGSTDATRELAESWQKDSSLRVQLVNLNPGGGLGAAISAGFDAATQDSDLSFIATADADLAYPLATLLAMLEKAESGFDLVSASPYIPGGQVEGVSGRRLWPSLIANAMHRWRFGGQTENQSSPHTFTCGFRIYRAELWPHIRPQASGFLATTELMVRALQRGARVAELPETLSTRRAGQSKMKVLRTTLSHLLFALRGPGS